MVLDSLNPSGRILMLAFVLVLFWVGAWGLVEEILQVVRKAVGVSHLQLYIAIVVGVVLLVHANPHLLEAF